MPFNAPETAALYGDERKELASTETKKWKWTMAGMGKRDISLKLAATSSVWLRVLFCLSSRNRRKRAVAHADVTSDTPGMRGFSLVGDA